MRYIVCEEPGQFLMKEKEKPNVRLGEVLVKIRAIGICGTDLHAYGGNQPFFSYPRILGHELGGEVIGLSPELDDDLLGQRVVIMPYISCLKCLACVNGKTNCCTHIKVLGVHTDGGMQEVISVPSSLLMPVADLSYEEIAIVEPLAIGAHAIRRAGLTGSETIVVMGCGPIGIGIMKLAQIKGSKVIALDIAQNRLDFVKNEIQVDHTVNIANDPMTQVQEITSGDMATVVFDATGNRQALESGPSYMAHGGKYVLVGLSKEELTFSHPAIHAKESTIMCSRNATREDFLNVLEVLINGDFPTAAYITHTVAFEDMIKSFESWLDPKAGVIKAMVQL